MLFKRIGFSILSIMVLLFISCSSITIEGDTKNQAPELEELVSLQVNKGFQTSIQLVVSDPDNDPVIFSLKESIAGVTLDSITGELSISASSLIIGDSFETIVYASDGEYADSTLLQFEVTTAQRVIVPENVATIQGAIDVARDGDTILIKDGIYFENCDMGSKELILASFMLVDGDSSHISKTVIDGSDSATILKMSGEHTTTLIYGISLKNGHGRYNAGGGLHLKGSSPTISNCVIENCKSTGG